KAIFSTSLATRTSATKAARGPPTRPNDSARAANTAASFLKRIPIIEVESNSHCEKSWDWPFLPFPRLLPLPQLPTTARNGGKTKGNSHKKHKRHKKENSCAFCAFLWLFPFCYIS